YFYFFYFTTHTPSIKHSLTSSHNRFISLSGRNLHFFAVSNHSSGPPPGLVFPSLAPTLMALFEGVVEGLRVPGWLGWLPDVLQREWLEAAKALSEEEDEDLSLSPPARAELLGELPFCAAF